MRKLMKNATAGSTLIEVVLAITILGLVSAPICSSLVLAARINARSREVMTAQLNVSSAVERLMAEGYADGKEDDFPGIQINAEAEAGKPYYTLTVSDEKGLVSVSTAVKIAAEESVEEPGGAS